jgi:hypothetical protein
MRRTKTVLAVVAVMAAMLVAFAAPALADNDRHDNDRNHHRWFDNNARHDDYWFGHRGDHDIAYIYDDDFDDYYYPYWGWGYYPYWGWGGGCEGPVCLID